MNNELTILYNKFSNNGLENKVNYKELYLISEEIIEYILTNDITIVKEFICNYTLDELFYMPFWIKALIFKIITLKCPTDIETIEFAIASLSWDIDENNLIIEEMRKLLPNSS